MYPYAFVVPAMALFGVFFVLPVLAGFVFSFTDWHIDRLFAPVFNGGENFSKAFDDEYFFLSVRNTLAFAVVTSVGKVVLGLVLALALTKNLATRDFLRAAFYFPYVISTVAVGLVFTSILAYQGMLNGGLMTLGILSEPVEWLGRTDTALLATMFTEVWCATGFTMVIFITGIQAIPKELYEAADIDGVRAFRRFWVVTLPMLAPAMTIAVTACVIGGLKVFSQVYIMTGGGPGFSTQVLSTYVFKTFSQGRLGLSTAMGLMLFLFVSAIALPFNRYLRNREVSL